MHSRTKVVAVLSACLALGIVLSGCVGSTKAPTLNFSGAQALDAGQSLNITSNENVKWSLSGPGSLASQTATSVTYDAPAVGSFVIPKGKRTSAAVRFGASADPTATITATPTASSSKVTTLTINLAEPPAFTNPSPNPIVLPNGVVGTTYSPQTLAVTGGAGTLTFTVSTGNLPAGLTLSNAGAITGTPTAGGTSTFTVKVSDSSAGGAQSATQSYTITVNQAPAITSPNSATFVMGMAGTFTVKTTGSPTPSLSESGTLPSGLTFKDNGDGTGTLSGTPAAGTAANYPIMFTATNGIGTPATQNFTLTVGQPPTITSGSSTTFTVGIKGTFTVNATGFPIPSLTNGGATLPSGVTFVDNKNGTGTLSGTPVAGTGKQYSISFTASNGVGSSATQNFTLTVNEAPSITSASSTTFAVGASSSFTVMATGFPVPTLVETGTTLPSGVSFKDNGNGTATLSGTPASGTNGTYTITITATNGIGSPATQTFTLTVSTTPVFTSPASTTFTVGTNGPTFTVTATGTPTPSITESGPLPNGVIFTPGTGSATLSGTPAAGTGGTYPITFTAASSSGTNQQSFTLTVDEAPTITSANSTTFTVGTNGTFTVTTTGFPQDPITETGPLPSGVTFVDNGNNTATLSGTPAAGTAGSYPITITASNGVAPNATQNFTLTVSTSTCGSGSESLLNGGYAFVLQGFDSSGYPALVGGILALNGSGAITSGVMDMNLLSGFDSANFGNPMTVSSGSYSVGSDQRGCMTVTTVAGTQHYRLSVGNITSGVASSVHLIQFDTTGPPSTLFTTGRMYLQSGGPFSNSSLNGSYAFGGSSIQTSTPLSKAGAVGLVAFNGSGTITSGQEDFNEDGILDGSGTVTTTWPTSALAFTGGSYSVSSNGRATLTLTGGGQTFHIVLYLVSTSQLLLITSDARTTNSLLAGEAFEQSGTPFAANPLSGAYVGYDSGLGNGGAGTDRTDIYLLGPLNSGSTAITGTQIRNDAGTFRQQSLSGETYSVSSAGRMIIPGGGPVLYLVNTSQAFMLAANPSVDTGFFQSQTGGPFSSSAPSGTYAYGVIDPEAAGSSINSGVAVFANPNLTLTEDKNSAGTLTVDSTQSFTYSVDSTGLGYIPASCTPGTNCQTFFYIISPTKAVVMDATSSTPKITIADK